MSLMTITSLFTSSRLVSIVAKNVSYVCTISFLYILGHCSSCSTCYRLLAVSTIFLAIFSFIGLITSEFIPRDYSSHTFIYEDSIILMDRINPFYYSKVKVRKGTDPQDHRFLLYLLSCDTAVVEHVLITHNITFTSHVNELLMPQDTVYLISGTSINISYKILDTVNINSSFVISSDLKTLQMFKDNNKPSVSAAHTYISSTGSQDKANAAQFTHVIDKTGYYYIGFSPSGNTTISVHLKIKGYKYSRPDILPACTLQRPFDKCSIPIPASLTDSYDNNYCLLGEVVSEPYYVDTISIDVFYEVQHHGKWNFITILFMCSLACSIVSYLCVFGYLCLCCVKSSKDGVKLNYVSIQ